MSPQLSPCLETGEPAAAPVTASPAARTSGGRIPVRCRQRNHFIPVFMGCTALLALASLWYLDIDWGKMLSRVPDIGVVFWNLAHLDFSNMDLVFSSLVETVSIAVLSLLYSLVLGILFGMLAARNVFRLPVLSVATQSFFTFLRAVPTPVWVLLMLVCLGMGPEAGVAGLCVHTTAFFTKSFAQSFESIPEETVESLEVTGASRLSIFCNAILPAAFSQIVAWAGMRLETNFSECAILGMVCAGGIGYVISNNLQGYDYGTAGVAIQRHPRFMVPKTWLLDYLVSDDYNKITRKSGKHYGMIREVGQNISPNKG